MYVWLRVLTLDELVDGGQSFAELLHVQDDVGGVAGDEIFFETVAVLDL